MDEDTRDAVDAINVQLRNLTAIAINLQLLARQHHDAIKILQEPLRDPSRV